MTAVEKPELAVNRGQDTVVGQGSCAGVDMGVYDDGSVGAA